ncbi:helix-turn-helix transcriptional regulator [Streptomyces macrosporus]|uniref:Helix-turn-helix transcriptional regulator n=1 Tax=Streptomyces macrosporus TaxID=44032 RepID=A0ABN3KK95_9ACTN
MATGPTTRRRQLGAGLRRLRRQKGLSLEEAGGLVGLSKATVSRYETKEGPVKWAFVDALCRVYGASDEERARLVELARSARAEGWWQAYPDAIPGRMHLFLTLENESVREDHYATAHVPGLLQTRRYAEALYRTDLDPIPEERLRAVLDVRMKRQEVLTRPDPLELRVVLDEAAVRRAGPPDVHREQLAHLVECARLPNVDLRILPFDRGLRSSAVGAFLVLVGADPSLDVVYQESLTASLYLEKDAEVEEYRRAFADLHRRALEPDASIALLDKLRKEP